MLQLLIGMVIALSYYLGRMQSDWVYAWLKLDVTSDPDRIAGVLVTMGVGVALFLATLLLVALLAREPKNPS